MESAVQRRLPKPDQLEDHIAAEKQRLEEQLPLLPQGPVRDQVLRKIRQLETASHINEWLTSPGLQAPT
jgi:hypothetical protein